VKRRANDLSTGQWMFDLGGGNFIATIGGVESD
jgi:hypothetical protein